MWEICRPSLCTGMIRGCSGCVASLGAAMGGILGGGGGTTTSLSQSKASVLGGAGAGAGQLEYTGSRGTESYW